MYPSFSYFNEDIDMCQWKDVLKSANTQYLVNSGQYIFYIQHVTHYN